MKRREHLYVNRNHWGVWLMVLCMAGSVATRFLLFSGESLWLYLIWPTAGAILFALITVCAGEEMLYRTAIPVWITGLAAIVRFWSMNSGLIS